MDGHRTRRSTKTEKAEAQKEQQQRGGRHGRTERETERGCRGANRHTNCSRGPSLLLVSTLGMRLGGNRNSNGEGGKKGDFLLHLCLRGDAKVCGIECCLHAYSKAGIGERFPFCIFRRARLKVRLG